MGANLLDLLLGIDIQSDGTPLTRRGSLNFGPDFIVTDDPTNDRITIELDPGPPPPAAAALLIPTEPGDGDLTFNGDGSGGAKQLGPISIIQLDGIFGDLVYTLSKADTGIQEGWMVFISIIGYKTPLTNTGSLSIKEGEADTDPVVFDVDVNGNRQVGIWYFDGVDWYRVISVFSGSPP